MPSVTITLTDTPAGGVSIKSDFTPAVGARCSAAQAAALDIITRTSREYGLKPPTPVQQAAPGNTAHVGDAITTMLRGSGI
jgi:hypothetical protein